MRNALVTGRIHLFMKYVIASNNADKLRELRDILSALGIEAVGMGEAGFYGEIEETGDTFEANALIKAEAVMRATGLPAIADDSGLGDRRARRSARRLFRPLCGTGASQEEGSRADGGHPRRQTQSAIRIGRCLRVSLRRANHCAGNVRREHNARMPRKRRVRVRLDFPRARIRQDLRRIVGGSQEQHFAPCDCTDTPKGKTQK